MISDTHNAWKNSHRLWTLRNSSFLCCCDLWAFFTYVLGVVQILKFVNPGNTYYKFHEYHPVSYLSKHYLLELKTTIARHLQHELSLPGTVIGILLFTYKTGYKNEWFPQFLFPRLVKLFLWIFPMSEFI